MKTFEVNEWWERLSEHLEETKKLIGKYNRKEKTLFEECYNNREKDIWYIMQTVFDKMPEEDFTDHYGFCTLCQDGWILFEDSIQ